MQAFAADAEHNGEPSPTVGAFVRMFAGLTSTQKAAEIIGEAGLSRVTLADLLRADDGDASIAALLAEMQAATKPVKPDELGKLGRAHIEDIALWFGVDPDSKIEYLKQTFVADGLPFVAEVAFAYFGSDSDDDGEPITRTILAGLNFSPALTNPFRGLGALGNESLGELLAAHEADDDEPVFILVHVASPRFTFIDKGKTAVLLPSEVARGLTGMVARVTGRWQRQKIAEIRHWQAALRRQEALTKSDKPMSIKDAAYQVMPEAYHHAAGDIGLANARQIMYAARRQILALTGRTQFDDQYFTQTLLPDYQRDFPRVTEDWDVVYDDRGHFIEPHTGRMIGLGTLAVRDYFAKVEAPSVRAAEVISSAVSTFGPQGRFSAALFIEKKGFLAILERARIAERYDVALMSTKGMSVVASRALIDGLAALGVRVFVLHDFDVSGFSIRKTFTESGRRYEFQNELDFVDIGLRLEDVQALDLPSEPVNLFSRESKKSIGERMATLAERLGTNGATDEEIEFLTAGQRVELNAMTSDQFVAFVEQKLEEHGAAKVIPNGGIIQDTYAAYVRGEKAKARFTEEMERAASEPVDIPADLEEQVRKWVEKNPEAPWTDAIAAIVQEGDNAVD